MIRLRANLTSVGTSHAPTQVTFNSTLEARIHIAFGGEGVVKLRNQPPITVRAGEFVIIPHGHEHEIRVVEDLHGLCGQIGFDRRNAHPLLSLLPPIIHVTGRDARLTKWVEECLPQDNGWQMGGEALADRVLGALFVQAVRFYIRHSRPTEPSWLLGLTDPQISAALDRIHSDWIRLWTVEDLAREVGMSRTRFASLFRSLVGETPIRYLRSWRLSIAAKLMRSERLTVAEVVKRVGYESEATFSKAFKRATGYSPSHYRDQSIVSLAHKSVVH